MKNFESKPSLSIIVATFNAENYVDEFMKCLMSQENKDFEVVINDGGSSDNTVNIINKYKKFLKIDIESRSDNGIYDAWNMAIDRAKSDWVMFIGADDRFNSNDAVDRIISAIKFNNDCNMIGFYGLVVDSGVVVKKIGGDICGATRKYMNLCHPGLLHKKSILGCRFSTKYRISSDYDFILKNINKIKYKLIDDVVVLVGGGGISRKMEFLAIKEAFIIQRENCVNKYLVCFYYFFVAWVKIFLRRYFGFIKIKMRIFGGD
ncbi:glycosyltransferase [Sphaerotilus sulfidivorans]